jgi:hypothetical protein
MVSGRATEPRLQHIGTRGQVSRHTKGYGVRHQQKTKMLICPRGKYQFMKLKIVREVSNVYTMGLPLFLHRTVFHLIISRFCLLWYQKPDLLILIY